MKFHDECLKAHNEFREKHQAPPLKLSDELCVNSQKLADYLVNKHEYGENTFCIVSTDGRRPTLVVDAIDAWYKEQDRHNFNVEPTSLSTGRFTQLVWKSTKQLGIGYAKNEGKVVLVANYFPPGNMQGEFLENVSPMTGEKTEMEESSEEEGDTLIKIQKDCLRIHNFLRKKHGAPPLELSESLCEMSQSFADYLMKKSQLGENTYCIISTDPDRKINGDEPVKSWYNEIERHNFLKEPTTGSTKNFSQLVWKSSEELGVGVAVNGRRTVVVANYSPPGNILGEFLENVLPSSEEDALKDNLENISLNTKNPEIGTEGNFVKDFLDAHNEYRKRIGVQPLEIHPVLSNYSQQWASFLAAKDSLQPRENCPFGENIYCASCNTRNYTIPGRKPVDFWYDEIKHREDDVQQMENYAQVISKVSKYLGVGVAKSETGHIYVVSNYASEKAIEHHESSNGNVLMGGCHVNEDGFTGFAVDGLEEHNKYRAMHGVPPLKLSHELCKQAQEWANQLTKLNIVQYRPPGKFGENIFEARVAQNLSSPIATAVRNWYNEIRFYNFKNPSWQVDADHFTQMIWKDIKEVGIGIATSKNGYIYIVANYSPREGDFEDNVLPALK